VGEMHDHPGVDCKFKILEGEMLEDRPGRTTRVYRQGNRGFINDALGTHRVRSEKGSVSLHIYSKI
jgi:hypothetical protein